MLLALQLVLKLHNKKSSGGLGSKRHRSFTTACAKGQVPKTIGELGERRHVLAPQLAQKVYTDIERWVWQQAAASLHYRLHKVVLWKSKRRAWMQLSSSFYYGLYLSDNTGIEQRAWKQAQWLP